MQLEKRAKRLTRTTAIANCLMPWLSQVTSEGPAKSPWTMRSEGTPWTKPLKIVLAPKRGKVSSQVKLGEVR